MMSSLLKSSLGWIQGPAVKFCRLWPWDVLSLSLCAIMVAAGKSDKIMTQCLLKPSCLSGVTPVV